MAARSIGLDIDRGALKAVQVSRSADAYTLRHIGYHRLPPGAIAEGEVADADLLATEIREFWSSHSFKGKSVILGVTHARVVVRLLDFPRMEEEDLESALAPANPDTDGDSILDNRDEDARRRRRRKRRPGRYERRSRCRAWRGRPRDGERSPPS